MLAARRLHGSPASLPDGGPIGDFPVEIVVLRLLVTRGIVANQLRQEADAVNVGRGFAAGDFGDRRQ